jgi:hypothetical protein
MWGRTVCLLLVATLGCDRVSGVRRQARVERSVDLGCVMSILESTPGVGDVHFSVLQAIDDKTSLVHSFDIEYAGARGALQVVTVRGAGQLVQQVLVRARGHAEQSAIDRARPLMDRIERRLASLCHVRWSEPIHESCTDVTCPALGDLPIAPTPEHGTPPALTMLDVA